MGVTFEVLLVTSAVGALQSFFFGVYLFTVRRTRNIVHLLLAFLLLAFTIRIFKSVAYYFSEGHHIPDLLMNFGFGTNLAIFPLLWLYLRAFFNNQYRFVWSRDGLHLIPAIVALLLSPVLTDRFWLNQYGYGISLLGMLLYVPLCIHLVSRNFSSLKRSQRIWIIGLVGGVVLVWMGYLGNYVFGVVPYIASPVAFSIVTYVLGFVALKEGSLFAREVKYAGSTFTQSQLDKCYGEFLTLVEHGKVLSDPAITLRRLASRLGVSANLLSEAINRKSGQSFPDFVNNCRVRSARILLEDPSYESQKIAAIAFECGFNSLSVFNSAFKKITGQTPSEYRKAKTIGPQ